MVCLPGAGIAGGAGAGADHARQGQWLQDYLPRDHQRTAAGTTPVPQAGVEGGAWGDAGNSSCSVVFVCFVLCITRLLVKIRKGGLEY